MIPFRGDLDWATLGAVPEMLQTSYGSLITGLDAQPRQSILIRGGTSSVGLATAALARQRGMTILSTTRNPDKAEAVTRVGADHVLIDDGDVARQVRQNPMDYLPTGVRLTAYQGDAADLPPQVLQDFLDAVAAGTAAVPISRVYQFDQIVAAHADMEQNRAGGKLVVTT